MRAQKRKYFWITFGVLALVILGGATFFLSRDNAPIPKDMRASVNFPLFYPKQLPESWHIDRTSFSKGAGVFTYTASSQSHKQKIFVSIQPQPDAFDFDNFYKKTLGKPSQFTTPIGQAATGDGEAGYKIGSLTTGDSWVLVSTTDENIKAKDLRIILSSMQEVQD